MTITQNQCRVPIPRLPLELISCIACNYWCITESLITLPVQDILYLYIHCIHTQIHCADAGNNTTQPRRPCPSPSPEQQTLRPGARASTLRRPAHALLPVDGTGPGALPKEHRVSPVWAHAYTSRCTNSKVTSARAQGNDGESARAGARVRTGAPCRRGLGALLGPNPRSRVPRLQPRPLSVPLTRYRCCCLC